MEERERLKVILSAMQETKAEAILVFDMDNRSPITDFVVLCNGRSQGHVRGIAEKVGEAMRKVGQRAYTVEGAQEGSWVLLDFDVVLVHVFHPETRAYYDLDSLLAEFPRVNPDTCETDSASGAQQSPEGAPPLDTRAVSRKTPSRSRSSRSAPVKRGAKATRTPGKAAAKISTKTGVKSKAKSAVTSAAKPAAKTRAKALAKPAAKVMTKPRKSRNKVG